MRKIDVSLLWPEDKRESPALISALHPSVYSDLGLGDFCREITQNEAECRMVSEILSQLVTDEEVIRYRQDVFEDLTSSRALFEAFERILDQLKAMEYAQIRPGVSEEAKLWYLFTRFKELEGYVDCITQIQMILRDLNLRSSGLCIFRDKLTELVEDPEFIALWETVKSLRFDVNQVRSITLGINLDESLNPSEVTLLSVNDKRFKNSGIIRDMSNWFSEGGTKPTMKSNLVKELVDIAIDDETIPRMKSPSKVYNPTNTRDGMFMIMYKDILRYLKPLLHDLNADLSGYMKVYTRDILTLIPELHFYLSFARLHRQLRAAGLPLCRATVRPMADRICEIGGLYNINLALHMLSAKGDPARDIVPNDVRFNDNGRILVLTGPNLGGKTVYTVAVGLAHVLFQAGVYIPGQRAEISPVDHIFTHFPVDENQTVDLGRLGEESQRIARVFEDATRHSIVLLNESFTSTSYSEGLFLARGVVKALRYLGARTIFNTHILELAAGVEELNQQTPGESKIASLVTGVEGGRRTYLVTPGAPLGISYAMDIAKRFGVSYDQIVELIDQKKTGSTEAL